MALASEKRVAKIGWLFLLAGALTGNRTHPTRHRAPIQALAIRAHRIVRSCGSLPDGSMDFAAKLAAAGTLQNSLRIGLVLAATAGISAGAWWAREYAGKDRYKVNNPAISPATMEQEGDGPRGKFFPSSVQTTDGKYIPSDYFLQSQACERCHSDIYKQWDSSAHHFSSFNNQWYRKSIEYMQSVNGVQPSKWCAGCHDPALLFSGMMDQPIAQNVQ